MLSTYNVISGYIIEIFGIIYVKNSISALNHPFQLLWVRGTLMQSKSVNPGSDIFGAAF